MAAEAAAKIVDICTDGACSGNPGPGGWGAVLRFGDHVKELHGAEPGATTNNRMELMAAIQALEALTRPAAVHLLGSHSEKNSGRSESFPRELVWRELAGVMAGPFGYARSRWRYRGHRPIKPGAKQ